MRNPLMVLDRNDRYTMAVVVTSALLWWHFIGSKKYGMKGMR